MNHVRIKDLPTFLRISKLARSSDLALATIAAVEQVICLLNVKHFVFRFIVCDSYPTPAPKLAEGVFANSTNASSTTNSFHLQDVPAQHVNHSTSVACSQPMSLAHE